MEKAHRTKNSSSDPFGSQAADSCTKDYKPWIWAILAMAVITVVWASYESYQSGGLVMKIFQTDDYKSLAMDKMNGMYKMGGLPQPSTAMPAGGIQNTYHDVIDKVRPALVSVDAAMDTAQAANPNAQAGDPTVNYTRVGSGIIIDPDGFILTSLHVIAGASSLKATVYGKAGARDYPVRVVNVNKDTDLALLRILGEGPFAYAILGDSDKVRTGDMVLAMGSPFGFDQTVTTGIISSKNRAVTINGRVYDNLLQTDTPINKGNSGGPLVNAQAEVIGINMAIYSPTGTFSGIGFALPINDAATLVAGVVNFGNVQAQAVAGQIVAWGRQGRQTGNSFKLPNGQIIVPPHSYRGRCIDCHPQLCRQPGTGPLAMGPGNAPAAAAVAGTQPQPQLIGGNAPAIVEEPFLGASLIEVDPVIASHFKLLHPTGVLVDQVYERTPAFAAGLARGDIILRVDGRKIQSIQELKDVLAAKKIGKKFELIVQRKDTRLTLKVRTAPQPPFLPQQPPQAQVPEIGWLGSEITPLKEPLASYIRSGVFVTDAGGLLARSGVMRGDIIVGVNKNTITDMASFIAITKDADPRAGILLDILRSGQPMFVTVQK